MWSYHFSYFTKLRQKIRRWPKEGVAGILRPLRFKHDENAPNHIAKTLIDFANSRSCNIHVGLVDFLKK